MAKDAAIMKLFTGKGGSSASRETAAETETRVPLSPISVQPRNRAAATPLPLGDPNHVHPAFSPSPQGAGTKKTVNNSMPPSSLSENNIQSAEYGENIAAFPPGTPEHKFAAPSTPMSSSRKRFGWSNIRQQSYQHEEPPSGSLLFPLSPPKPSLLFCNSSQVTVRTLLPGLSGDSGHAVEYSHHKSHAQGKEFCTRRSREMSL
jgi:hypothetical protein